MEVIMKHIAFIISLVFTVVLADSFLYAEEKVTIIAEDAWYPYTGILNGTNAEGITVDVIKAAFKAAGVNAVLITMPYDRGLAKVEMGEEVALFNVAKDASSEHLYLWPSDILFTASLNYYTRIDFNGQNISIKNLEGKKLGCTEGYQYGDEIYNNTKVIKEWSKTDKINLSKLIAGRIDATPIYEGVANYLLFDMKIQQKVKMAGKALSMDLFLAFSKKHKDSQKYLTLYNQGFAMIKKDGTYDKIWKEWDAKLKLVR
jgi:polar amino acid transport system substrate-binding protein